MNIVAIDGYSGAGKSVLASLLSERLGYFHINSGAIYRALALKLINEKYVPEQGEKRLLEILKTTSVEQKMIDGKDVTFLDGIDVSTNKEIRSLEVSMFTPKISPIPALRSFAQKIQRGIAEKNNVVVEGRDVTTVVFPYAQVKIFVTADPLVRAKRRQQEFLESGKNVSLEKVFEEMNKRDNADETRENSPLVQSEDAFVLNNTNLTLEELVQTALDYIETKIDIKTKN